jgi:hypothetical protein
MAKKCVSMRRWKAGAPNGKGGKFTKSKSKNTKSAKVCFPATPARRKKRAASKRRSSKGWCQSKTTKRFTSKVVGGACRKGSKKVGLRARRRR